MLTTPIKPAGRGLFILANLFVTIGSFIADFNETHVFNEKWPPHARFHNGQTMSLSLLLSSLSLYLVLSPATTIAQTLERLLIGTIVGSLYCIAGLSAILYPGTAWVDPEFHVPIHAPQLYIFGGQLIAIWSAYRRATASLTTIKAA